MAGYFGGGAAASVTVGTTTLTGGTDTRVLFDDAGAIGEDAGFVYAKASDALTVAGTINVGGAAGAANTLTISGTSITAEGSTANANQTILAFGNAAADGTLRLTAQSADALLIEFPDGGDSGYIFRTQNYTGANTGLARFNLYGHTGSTAFACQSSRTDQTVGYKFFEGGSEFSSILMYGSTHATTALRNALTLSAGSSGGAQPIIFQTGTLGSEVERLRISSGSGVSLERTITAAGTTGAQTINKMSGTVNFAAGASTLVVTNSLVGTSSIVYCVVRTNDTTATIKNVVPAAGSFTITLSAAATAETSVGFFVTN